MKRDGRHNITHLVCILIVKRFEEYRCKDDMCPKYMRKKWCL